MRRSLLMLFVFVSAVLTACAPGTRPQTSRPQASRPSFTVLQDGTGLQYVDPPGVGDAVALFDVHLRATNPNAIAVTLTSFDGTLTFGGLRAGTTSLDRAVEVPPQGSADFTLAIRMPLAQAPRLVGTLGQIVGGATTGYRLDASARLDIAGAQVRLPTWTVASGPVLWIPAWHAPEITLTNQAPSVRVESLSRAVLEVPVTWHNPGRLGTVVQGPTLQLALGGATVVTAELGRVVAPAGATVPVTLSFSFDPLRVGPALVTQLRAVAAGAAQLEFRVSGPLELQVPGVASHRLDAAELVRGALR